MDVRSYSHLGYLGHLVDEGLRINQGFEEMYQRHHPDIQDTFLDESSQVVVFQNPSPETKQKETRDRIAEGNFIQVVEDQSHEKDLSKASHTITAFELDAIQENTINEGLATIKRIDRVIADFKAGASIPSEDS